MLAAIISLIFLLLFAELSSANFKRLAPVLEAWDQAKKAPGQAPADANPFPWIGGWEKLATLVWAFGASIPLITFALSCRLFLGDPTKAGNLILGTTVGANIVGLSLAFALALLSGPLTFFRLRTVTSPVFLLLATVVFTYMCLNKTLSPWEGSLLLLLMIAYGFYFRRFSSEWKHYERAFSGQSLLESAEGILPIIAVLCMGVGFFLLAILVAYPLVQELQNPTFLGETDPFRVGAIYLALFLSVPWLTRCLFGLGAGSTSRAITLTSISHACLLNVLFVPALASFLGASDLSSNLLTVHLPALLLLTGVFVSALLIEKERGGFLPWVLIGFYIVYTGVSLLIH
jgi:Ca2+/Na+ antiporter